MTITLTFFRIKYKVEEFFRHNKCVAKKNVGLSLVNHKVWFITLPCPIGIGRVLKGSKWLGLST